jgi:uncharacterized membrane protein
MDHPVVLFLLRAVHIFFGVFWIGGVLLVTLFLLPASRAAGPAGQQFLQEIMLRRKLPRHLVGSGMVTILAGIGLYARNMSLTHGAWARSPMGVGMSIGAIAAILGITIGITVNAPAAKRIALAGAPGGTPLGDAERSALMRRLQVATMVNLALLVIAVLTMATARYY